MRNLFYYLKQYGKLSFREYAINEVDSLILCQLIYLNLEEVLSKDTYMNLESLLAEENEAILIKNTFSPQKNLKLIRELRNSNRFVGVGISDIRNTLSYDYCEQFCAVVYHIEDIKYVSFRGTDLTILGWKENFNMSYQKEVPSQRDSLIYLTDIYEKYHQKMIVGGHSKGGNLAMYSVVYSNTDIRQDVIKIYNFDGPGLYLDIFSNEEYGSILEKMITMSTQEALIGVLLYHVSNIIYIKASGFGILQHEPYNWQVAKNGLLKRVKRNSIPSRIFASAVRNFFQDTNEEERKQFVDILFTIVEVAPNTSVNDFRYHPLRFISGVRKRFKKIPKEEQHYFKITLKKFRKSFYKTLKMKLKKQKKKQGASVS